MSDEQDYFSSDEALEQAKLKVTATDLFNLALARVKQESAQHLEAFENFVRDLSGDLLMDRQLQSPYNTGSTTFKAAEHYVRYQLGTAMVVLAPHERIQLASLLKVLDLNFMMKNIFPGDKSYGEIVQQMIDDQKNRVVNYENLYFRAEESDADSVTVILSAVMANAEVKRLLGLATVKPYLKELLEMRVTEDGQAKVLTFLRSIFAHTQALNPYTEKAIELMKACELEWAQVPVNVKMLMGIKVNRQPDAVFIEFLEVMGGEDLLVHLFEDYEIAKSNPAPVGVD